MADACHHAPSHKPSNGAVVEALRSAETRVALAGGKWTEPRRRVYELLLEAGTPVKAYDLMEAYSDDRTAKPPTVYRALDFLETAGLVHRIASLNAFVACQADDPTHAAAFLICDCCGSAQEFDPGEVRAAATAARAEGFAPRAIGLEVRGTCRACA